MTPDEFDVELATLEVKLERLRALYEQYFMGVERIEPAVARKDVDRRFWLMRKVKVRNTARRFKLQTLLQRYNTLQQHWGKICRQIENGTYKRHIARVERQALTAQTKAQQAKIESGTAKAVARASSLPPPPSSTGSRAALIPPAPSPAVPSPARAPEGIASTGSAAPAPPRPGPARPPPLPRRAPAAKAPPAPARAEATKPPAPSRRGESLDTKIDRLHRELAAAQERLQPGSQAVSRKALAESLRVTEAKLRHKHAGRDVDFQVVVKDGRVAIKPVVGKG